MRGALLGLIAILVAIAVFQGGKAFVDKARLRSYEIGRSDDWRSPASSAGSDNRNCSDLASVRILAIFKLKFEPCEKKTLVLVEIVVNTRFFAVVSVVRDFETGGGLI